MGATYALDTGPLLDYLVLRYLALPGIVRIENVRIPGNLVNLSLIRR
ncbi:MAG: hypothetical protein V2A73_12660 [Pseudomonadota bacterium]